MPGFECYTDRSGQHTIQIFGVDGSQPENPTGSIPQAGQIKQGQSK